MRWWTLPTSMNERSSKTIIGPSPPHRAGSTETRLDRIANCELDRLEYREYFRFLILTSVVHLQRNDQRYPVTARRQKWTLVDPQASVCPKIYLPPTTLHTQWSWAQQATAKHSPCPRHLRTWITSKDLLAVVQTVSSLYLVSHGIHRGWSRQPSPVDLPCHLRQCSPLKVLALPALAQCHQNHGLCFRHPGRDLPRLLQLRRRVYLDRPTQNPEHLRV